MWSVLARGQEIIANLLNFSKPLFLHLWVGHEGNCVLRLVRMKYSVYVRCWARGLEWSWRPGHKVVVGFSLSGWAFNSSETHVFSLSLTSWRSGLLCMFSVFDPRPLSCDALGWQCSQWSAGRLAFPQPSRSSRTGCGAKDGQRVKWTPSYSSCVRKCEQLSYQEAFLGTLAWNLLCQY